ncbi:hypothetical protein KM043_018074 [Ampulex compressa]|nr:hypothetical protein KM043_018074 [Ampulex compressa]
MSLNNETDCIPEVFESTQWEVLQELCRTNAEYFAIHQDENGIRIRAALLAILDHLGQLQPIYKEITKIAPLFDLDAETPGNGYRSFLVLVDKCTEHTESVCYQLYSQRDSIFFRKSYYMRELEAWSQLLASLCTCLQHLKTLNSWGEQLPDGKKSLFASSNHSPQELLDQAEDINLYCFYGRCLGFQFHDSLKRVLKTLLVCMASFSEAYYSNGTLLGRCANSFKYFLDPEARARRIVNISQHADVSFCQAFWLLNETDIMHTLPSIITPSLAINQVISIPPEELTISTLDGTMTSIPIPCSHIGKKPIHVRLLSAKRRVGMVGSGGIGGELLGPSKGLIIHCHGGGFVAQTSRSHEVYLRNWAVELDMPILSVDYSLAPEAPYPRALEEVLYAYAWALKHTNTLLGSTAEKVLLVGDSAGANLNCAVTLRCLELNIRIPDGLFMAYSPMLVEFVPSPSRLLCLADPLLPFGFMMRCLKAYAATDNKKLMRVKDHENGECTKSDAESLAEVSESDLIALALSPNGDETNDAHKLASLPSDSTLNSVSLTEVDDDNNSGTDKSWTLFGWSLTGKYKETRQLDTENGRSPSEEFVFTIPRDPHLSPYLAADTDLARMPPIKMLTLELDPCLDDCVMFAKKLRSLGKTVTLDIVPGLPHGFLNFSLISKEASQASALCVKRIQELLEL